MKTCRLSKNKSQHALIKVSTLLAKKKKSHHGHHCHHHCRRHRHHHHHLLRVSHLPNPSTNWHPKYQEPFDLTRNNSVVESLSDWETNPIGKWNMLWGPWLHWKLLNFMQFLQGMYDRFIEYPWISQLVDPSKYWGWSNSIYECIPE